MPACETFFSCLFNWGVFHWGDKRFGDDRPDTRPEIEPMFLGYHQVFLQLPLIFFRHHAIYKGVTETI